MKPRYVVLGLLIQAAVLAPAAAVAGLPGSLDDRDFWRLVESLSEPSGEFADDNFVSNELGLQRVLPELRASFGPGGVYIGVGPEQNFTYIANLEPGIAFVLDIRRQNLLEHLLYKALFELADDRADFLSKLFSRPRPSGLDEDSTADDLLRAFRSMPADHSLFEVTLAGMLNVLINEHGFDLSEGDEAAIVKVLAAFYESGPEIAYVYRETDEWHPNYVQLMNLTDASGRNWSYLASAESFERVRRLERKNLVVPVVGDFAGTAALRAIGNYVRAHDAVVDVFYVSNVEAYLFQDGNWRAFYDNVATLPITDGSMFVRTFFGSTARECAETRPPVRTPMLSPIADLLDDYRDGEIESQCSLVERSR